MPTHKLTYDGTPTGIGYRIMAARLAANKSQSEIARALGMTYQGYARYENGGEPTVPALKKIAAAIGVKACQLCGCCDD